MAAIPEDKKLVVVIRVEPGCLGPQGDQHVADFCQFAIEKMKQEKEDFVALEVVPRIDKTLPEIEYKLRNKKLPNDKAKKYLSMFERDVDDFEDTLQSSVMDYVELYMAR